MKSFRGCFFALASMCFIPAASASYENTCLLTGTLLQAPQERIASISPMGANGQPNHQQEYEKSTFEIKVIIEQSEIAGRADSGCQLPQNRPYELSLSLPEAYALVNAQKGDKVKLLHVRKTNKNSEYEKYILKDVIH